MKILQKLKSLWEKWTKLTHISLNDIGCTNACRIYGKTLYYVQIPVRSVDHFNSFFNMMIKETKIKWIGTYVCF